MTKRLWPGIFLAGWGLAALAPTGCQTWTGGMTLPSARYLQHPPQYIPPSPPYPLSRELAGQEATAAAAAAGGVPGPAVPLPAPVPPPAVPGGGGGPGIIPPPPPG
jgi:hypothetical protein